MLSITLFSTSTCAHCKPMKATLEELAEQYGDKVHLNTIVVDKDPSGRKMATEWQISAVPTTLLIMNQEEIGQIQGNHPKEQLEELIEGCLQSDVLQESPGGVSDTCDSVLCDSGGEENPAA